MINSLYLRKTMINLSITGADNNTNINELAALSQKYPQLELAVLYFPEKENIQRNPGVAWRQEFFKTIKKENTALHLCGKGVFDAILSKSFTSSKELKEFAQTSRIQININARHDIFTHNEIHTVYEKLLGEGFELILQYHERSRHWILPFIEKHTPQKVNILLDASLGKGITPKEFTAPKEVLELSYPIGFAGGLNPDNIELAHSQVKSLGISNYWLDLESGVRTDNEFDMSKAYSLCRKVLE